MREVEMQNGRVYSTDLIPEGLLKTIEEGDLTEEEIEAAIREAADDAS